MADGGTDEFAVVVVVVERFAGECVAVVAAVAVDATA